MLQSAITRMSSHHLQGPSTSVAPAAINIWPGGPVGEVAGASARNHGESPIQRKVRIACIACLFTALGGGLQLADQRRDGRTAHGLQDLPVRPNCLAGLPAVVLRFKDNSRDALEFIVEQRSVHACMH